MPETIRFTRPDVDRLAAKLDTLDLTPDEHKLLLAVFDRARESAGDEVQGHMFSPVPTEGNVPISEGFMGALQPYGRQGFGPVGGGSAIITELT